MIFSSGYSDPRHDDFGLPPGARVLAKPYGEPELLARVREALDAD